MIIVFAVLAGIIVGAGSAGYLLSRRWQNQIEQAKSDMQAIADQHQQEAQTAKEMKQKVADLQFQLTQANNELRALRNGAANND